MNPPSVRDPAASPPAETVRLSLCMATMNRGDVIGETLASIAAQGNLTGVELVMIDGSRDDATERVLASWRDRLPPVRYERRPPQGFDRDYCAAVAAARGDYCWLVADDDPLLPGAFAAIRPALADEPDFVVLNGEVWDPELKELLRAGSLALAADRIFRAGEDDALAAAVLAFLSYVGSVVVRRGLWNARETAPYLGTDFVHVGVLMQRPIERSVVVLVRPQVRLRFGVALWTGRFFDIWMFQWPKLIWSIPQLSPAVKQAVTWEEPWRQARQLLTLRATGHYTLDHYRRRLAARPVDWRYRLIARMVAVLPARPAAWAAQAYFRRVGRCSGPLAWELRQVLAGG